MDLVVQVLDIKDINRIRDLVDTHTRAIGNGGYEQEAFDELSERIGSLEHICLVGVDKDEDKYLSYLVLMFCRDYMGIRTEVLQTAATDSNAFIAVSDALFALARESQSNRVVGSTTVPDAFTKLRDRYPDITKAIHGGTRIGFWLIPMSEIRTEGVDDG